MKTILLRVLCVITPLFVIAAYYLIFEREVSAQLNSDLPAHLKFAQELFSEPHVIHPLFHLTILAVSEITHWNLGKSSILILMVSVLSSAVTLAMVLREKLIGQYSWSVIILIISLLFCVSGIYLPSFCEKIYFCSGSQNSFHSPTLIFSKPFAFISLILFSRLSTAPSESRIRLAVALSIILVLGALAKPNFALAFLFSAPLFLYFTLDRSEGKAGMAMISAPLLILVVVLAMQYYWNYMSGSVAAYRTSSVVIDFFGVARLFSPNPFVSLALFAAFPLATILVYPSVFKDRIFTISFLTFLVALLQYWFLAESGREYSAGNFGWGIETILPLVSVLCVGEVLNQIRSDKTVIGMFKASLLALLFCAHLVSGLLYMKQLLTTASYD